MQLLSKLVIMLKVCIKIFTLLLLSVPISIIKYFVASLLFIFP